MLIDDGDIAHPTDGQRDLAWISGWIETAGLLGAQCARVVAGKTPPSKNSPRSISGLKTLVECGKANNVRVMTENWLSLLTTPDYVRRVMEAVDIGLCADFGNWRGATKYDDLAAIFPFAESCHAKCSFSAEGTPDREDYVRCLELSRGGGFSGPYTVIYYSASVNEWNGLEMLRRGWCSRI